MIVFLNCSLSQSLVPQKRIKKHLDEMEAIYLPIDTISTLGMA